MSAQASIANHWKAFFLSKLQEQHPPRHLTAIRGLTAAAMTPDQAFLKASREDGYLFILTIAPDLSTVQVFHHPTSLGGSLSDPVTHLVALHGLGHNANPVEFIQSSFTDVTIKVPTWRELDETQEDEEAFSKVETQEAEDSSDTLHAKNYLIAPLPIALAVLTTAKQDSTSVALKLMSTMSAIDSHYEDQANEDDSIESYGETFFQAIQFLWAASRGGIPPLLYGLTETAETARWCSRLRQACIAPIFTPISQPITTGTVGGTSVAPHACPPEEQMRYDLAYIKGKMEEKECAKEKDEMKKGFKKLPKPIQRMILLASTPSGDLDIIPDPTEKLSEFLETKDSGTARTTLQYQLEHEFHSSFYPSQALASAMHKGFFHWDRPDLPSNFSVFLCGNTSILSPSASDALAHAMKAEEGKGLSDSDINKALKASRHLPKSLHDGIDMLQNFYSVSNIIFGKDSPIALCIKDAATNALQNRTHYELQQASDPDFITMVLQRVDKAIQTFLHSCLHSDSKAEVNTRCLDLSRDYNDIIDNRFSLHLYECLKQQTPSLDKFEQKQPKRPRPEGDKEDNILPNKAVKPDWKMKADERFGAIFHKYQDKCPKDHGRLICMRFFLKGSCFKGCKRAHKLSPEAEQEFGKFVEKCRELASGKKRNKDEAEPDFS